MPNHPRESFDARGSFQTVQTWEGASPSVAAVHLSAPARHRFQKYIVGSAAALSRELICCPAAPL